MSSKNEEADEGGRLAPAELGRNSEREAFLECFSQMVEAAIGHKNSLTPEARIQVDLRNAKERSKALEELLVEVCPSGVDPELWERWLKGGPPSFGVRQRRTGSSNEAPSQTLLRAPQRVAKQEKKVQRLREQLPKKIEDLKTQLRSEEDRLEYLKAQDSAALQWFVTDNMISMMSAAFAMGPAWTLMRAISGYMSDEEVDRMMPFHDSDEKAHAAKNHRAEKQQETDAILETLDLFSGDNSFENELRAAIKEVTARYAGTRSERVPNGRRRRAASKIKSSINPEAKMDSKEVLEGLMYRADPFA